MDAIDERTGPLRSERERDVIVGAGYEFLSEMGTGLCPNCGELFPRSNKGRPRRFCSEKCRITYHHKYPNKKNWKCIRKAVCPVCGKEFDAEREYGRMRKYCSHACANRGRAREKKGESHDRDDD